MTRPMIRVMDDQSERFCRKCREWWPDTSEFFFHNKKKDGFRSPCKACIDEKRAETATTKPCSVPGCTNPRYSWRYARCYEHRSWASSKAQITGEGKAAKPTVRTKSSRKASKRSERTLTIDHRRGILKVEQVSKLDTFKQLEMVVDAYREQGYQIVEKR